MHGQTEKRTIRVELSEDWDTNDSGLTAELVEEAVVAIMAAAESVAEALREGQRTRSYNGICISRTHKLSESLEVTLRLDTDLEG